MLEKTLKNFARDDVKEIISNDEFELKKDSIKNINYLFEEEVLENVELLPDNRKRKIK